MGPIFRDVCVLAVARVHSREGPPAPCGHRLFFPDTMYESLVGRLATVRCAQTNHLMCFGSVRFRVNSCDCCRPGSEKEGVCPSLALLTARKKRNTAKKSGGVTLASNPEPPPHRSLSHRQPKTPPGKIFRVGYLRSNRGKKQKTKTIITTLDFFR